MTESGKTAGGGNAAPANPGAFARKYGIRMQATRSRPPKNWWSRKWQEYMETLHMGARIGRGRQYATGGNVRDIYVAPGLATATVKGGAPEPYRCEILCETVEEDARGALAKELRARPMLLARLLAGELPEDVELRFKIAGCPLLPSQAAQLKARCSCPDGATFCKHAAAALFLLGELFDVDPLYLLEFRGIGFADLFGCDRAAGIGQIPGEPRREEPATAQGSRGKKGGRGGEPGDRPQPGSAGAPALQLSGEVFAFPGQMPLWRGENRFADTVRDCSARAAEAAKRLLSEPGPAK